MLVFVCEVVSQDEEHRQTTHPLELSNMESDPKWDAPPRVRARFIFAFV